jgi:hypothetical protein
MLKCFNVLLMLEKVIFTGNGLSNQEEEMVWEDEFSDQEQEMEEIPDEEKLQDSQHLTVENLNFENFSVQIVFF